MSEYQLKYSGENIDDAISKRMIVGTTAPTSSTVGVVGQCYFNSTDGKIYICKLVSGSAYTWDLIDKYVREQMEQKADKAFKTPITGYRNGYIKLFEMNKSVGAYYYATVVQGGISNLIDILEIAVVGETISNTIVYRKSTAFQSSKSNVEIYDDGTKYVGYLKATQYSHMPTVNIDGVNLCTVINTVVSTAPTGTKVYDSATSEKLIATTDKIDTLFSGNVSSGTLTLTQAITNYNRLIIICGTTNETTYIHDFTPSKLVDGVIEFAVAGGTVKITTSGTTVTITTATKAIRKIVGISSSV